MNVIEVAQNLMRFKSETGNLPEVKKCMDYMQSLPELASAKIDIFEKEGLAPVFFARNCDGENFDVMVLGHIDVVPATDDMFDPFIKDGKLHGRGSLDMKSFAAVALNSLAYVLTHKLNLKFGVLLSSDEEKGSKGLEAFLEAHPAISSKIVLDNDVGGDIGEIIAKCKNPVFVKIIAHGTAAHGSTPWEGVDANEILMQTLQNVRKIYPYYSKEGVVPADKWIDTVHFAKVCGGDVANVICNYAEALCDFRLTETSTVENLCANLDKAMTKGAEYRIVSSSTPVVMDESNPDILNYKAFAEKILGRPLTFEYMGGATDSRSFAIKGSTVIMHSGTGEGMHSVDEYVVVDTVEKIAEIQVKFLEHLANQNK